MATRTETTAATPATATPSSAPSARRFAPTWLLSMLLGVFGIDRFYLGRFGTGILKLVTLGGLGLWALVDLTLVVGGYMRDRYGKVVTPASASQQTLAIIITPMVVCAAITVFLLFLLRVATSAD